jgi:hypothetical protein
MSITIEKKITKKKFKNIKGGANMFKKLNEQVEVLKVKNKTTESFSIIENEVVFGNLLEDFIEVKNLDRKAYLDSIMPKFFEIVKRHLQIEDFPKITLSDKISNTFGIFKPGEQSIEIVISNRHPVDSLRTLAHELVHWRQLLRNEMNELSGQAGSPQENEANSLAGVIMRDFNHTYPDCLNYE